MASASYQSVLEMAERHTQPFRYCRATNIYDEGTCDSLLYFFDHAAPWSLVRRPFYEEYELPLTADLLKNVCDVLCPDQLGRIRSAMEGAFGVSLQNRVEVIAHKMATGQRIGIHNDFGAPWRSHRLVVWLSRGYSESYGGHLVLFNSHDPADVHRVILPEHNTAVAFALTSASYHAVTEVTEAIRYSVVYSFWTARTEDS